MLLEFAGEAGELFPGLGEVVAAGGEAAGELGDAVGVGGSAGGDALELDGGLVGLCACFANLLVERVAACDARGVFVVHRFNSGGLGIDLSGERAISSAVRSLLGVHLRHAAGEHDAEPGAEFVAKCAVTLGLGGLALEGVHLAGDFVEDVVDTGEVLLGGLEAQFGETLLGLEAGDAGGFFDDGAAVEGLGAEKLADAFLADDGVGLATEAGAHEDVLNVAKAADFAVEEIFAVAGAEEAAGDGDFAGADWCAAELAAADLQDDVIWRCAGRRTRLLPLPPGLICGHMASPSMIVPGWASATASSVSAAFSARRAASSQSVSGVAFVDDDLWFAFETGAVVDLWVDEGERDLGHAGGLALTGAGEDDVFHLDAAEGLGGLLAEDPGDGVERCWTCRSHWGQRWRRCLRPESWTSVRSQKDLKPSIWTFLSLSKCDLCGRRIGEASPHLYD